MKPNQDNNFANPTYVTTLENSWYSLQEYIVDQGKLVEDW